MRKSRILRYLLVISLCLSALILGDTPIEAADNEWRFDYSGSTVDWTAPSTGKYYIEVVGGGSEPNGKGGKLTGYLNIEEGTEYYITVGGKGGRGIPAGYNGGGEAYYGAGSGGGATSITTGTDRGVLANYSNNKDEVIAVAGGAGGVPSCYPRVPAYDDGWKNYSQWNHPEENQTSGSGIVAGKIESGRFQGNYHSNDHCDGGTNTTGYAFGKGQNAIKSGNESSGAGGGGYYGGYAPSAFLTTGGAGGGGYYGDMYNFVSSSDGSVSDGYCIIRYEGPVETTITVDPGLGGIFDGSEEPVSIKVENGDVVDLSKLVVKEGYTFEGWKKKEGLVESDYTNTTITAGFESIKLVAKYKAPLVFDIVQSDVDDSLNMSFSQSDYYEKSYKLYQSYDKVNWSFAQSNSDDILLDEEVHDYSYTTGVRSLYLTPGKLWKLEAWGAQGGGPGGKGGYSVGYTTIPQTVYFVTGGMGGTSLTSGSKNGGGGAGGYNGGGYGGVFSGAPGPGGGGATHIATTNRGLLTGYNGRISELLLVAGGGGGRTSTGYGGGTIGGSTVGGGLGATQNAAGGTASPSWGGSSSVAGFGYGANAWFNNGAGGGGLYGGGASIGTSGSGGGGGSGYANTSKLDEATTTGDVNIGNGRVKITGIEQDISKPYAHGIKFKDTAAPNAASNGETWIEDGKRFASWEDNGDNGVTIYHYVESVNKATGKVLNTSEVKENYVKSGVMGYYYYVDYNPTGTVTKNHTYTEVPKVVLSGTNKTTYVHVAVVDRAGNLSSTYTFSMKPGYIVRYNANGGTGSIIDGQGEFGIDYVVGENTGFSKVGYNFVGWGKGTNTEVTNQPGDIISLEESEEKEGLIVTLYAIWEAGTYNVQIHQNNPNPNQWEFTYNNIGDGWELSENDSIIKEFTYDKDTLPVSTTIWDSDIWYARDGYYSATKPNGQGGGAYYANGAKNLTTELGSTVHVYVSWRSRKIPLTATDNGDETVKLDWTPYEGEPTDMFKAYESSDNITWKQTTLTSDTVSTDGSGAVSMQQLFSTWRPIGMTGQWSVRGNYLYNAENTGGVTGFYDPDPNKQYVTSWNVSFDACNADTDDDDIGCFLKLTVNSGSGTSARVTGYLFMADSARYGVGGIRKGCAIYRLDNVLVSSIPSNLGYNGGSGGGVTMIARTYNGVGSWVPDSANNYTISVSEDNEFVVKLNGTTVLTGRDNNPNTIIAGTIGMSNYSQSCYYKAMSWNYTRFIRNRTVDVIAPDLASPNTPVMVDYKDNILSVKSEDNGTYYNYKAEAYAYNNLRSPKCLSNEDDLVIKQGIKGYYYYLDNSDVGIASKCTLYKNKEADDTFKLSLNGASGKYLHILAVDKAKTANKSGVLTVELPENKVYTLTFDAEDGINKVNNQELYSKTVDWNFKGWSSAKCTTGCSHASGSFNHYDNTDRCLTNCVCKTWDEVKFNSDIKTTGNITMRAHYAGGKTTLEVAEKPGYVFIGWFDKPIVGVQLQQGTLKYGGGENWNYSRESLHTINGNITLYAYYNRKPIFADVYDGMFFEGQNVTYNDLLSLVSAFDYEDDYYNAVIKAIYDLPEVNQEDIYIPIHESMGSEDTINNPNLNGEYPGYKFDSEHWVDLGDGTYKRKSDGRIFYTIERKMQLENQINSSDLVLKIESIEYNLTDGVYSSDFVQVNGTIPDSDWENESRLNTYYLDTSTGRIDMSQLSDESNPDAWKNAIGEFTITYTVTDNGYTCGGDLVGNPVTLNYSRVCQIQYNNYPVLYLRNMAILKGDENIKEKQLVLDAEDCVNNPPWWYLSASENPTGVSPKVGYTFDNLQNSVEEVGIYNVKLNTYLPVDVKWSDVNQAVQDWSVGKKSQDILNLKGNSEEFITGITKDQIYNAILSYNVEFDCTDQFGKKASGNINDSKYLGNQDVKPDIDSTVWHQSKEERSIIVYIVNSEKDIAMIPASIIENLRYISKDFINTLSNSSYWASSGYGKEILDEILKMYENEDKVPDKYLGLYNNAGQNKKVQIGINDYTK